MAEPDEPTNDFVEFVRVWGDEGLPEAIMSYESSTRGTMVIAYSNRLCHGFQKLNILNYCSL